MCNCNKPRFNYVGKFVKVNDSWYEVVTQDKIKQAIGIMIEGNLTWIRAARIQEVKDY
jgi:hypothetical protein